MKNSNYLLGILIILLVFGGLIYFNSQESIDEGIKVGENVQGETQKVVISEKNLNYYPNTITVKSGQPVSISLDSSVSGCLRSFTIKEFGVSKYLKTPEDEIIFTPTKTGTFTFACSMGMAYGKLVVK
jgi:plastocyanin domain-containing protein